MDWKPKSVAGLLIAATLPSISSLSQAQSPRNAVDGVRWPARYAQLDVTGEPTPALPPIDEELPPGSPDTPPPQIDDQISDAPFFTGEQQLPAAASSDDAAVQEPTPEALASPSAANDGTDDGELIPQEVIRERYPDGSVKIERGVAQDEQENYVNHGPWRMRDQQGNIVVSGAYRFGKRHGKWTRRYQADEAAVFGQPPFTLFNGPFVSTAYFDEDDLNGHWIITDSNDAKVCDWAFQDGRRHGESIWYYHTGRTMRVIQYRHGQIHGELSEWDTDGQQVTQVEYQDGRRLEKTVETYTNGQQKVEGIVLQARLIMKEPDDWWEVKLATYARQGKDEKHGAWTAWYENGQVKFKGNYLYDQPSGEFTWWHANGQKSLHAYYNSGQKTGEWTWWHENGQKAIQGQYQADNPVNRWVWWDDQGKVGQRIDFSQAAETVVGAPVGTESILLRQPQN